MSPEPRVVVYAEFFQLDPTKVSAERLDCQLFPKHFLFFPTVDHVKSIQTMVNNSHEYCPTAAFLSLFPPRALLPVEFFYSNKRYIAFCLSQTVELLIILIIVLPCITCFTAVYPIIMYVILDLNISTYEVYFCVLAVFRAVPPYN